MNFWPALLGALIGGSLTFTAGFFSDRRKVRNDRAGRVIELMAVFSTSAVALRDHVTDLIGASEGPTYDRPNRRQFSPYLDDMGRALVELGWLTVWSPLNAFVNRLYESTIELVVNSSTFDEGPELAELSDAISRSVLEVDTAMRFVATKSPGYLSWYLQSKRVPVPPPPGGHPPRTRFQDNVIKIQRFLDRFAVRR